MDPLTSLHSNLVIFKYAANSDLETATNLYIPIWLYSNDYAMRYDLVLDVLYIPIWLYSNSPTNAELENGLNLYIPIWLYSN